MDLRSNRSRLKYIRPSAGEHGAATDAVMTGLRSQDAGDRLGDEEAHRRADERGDAGASDFERRAAESGEPAAAAVAYRRAYKRGEPAAATHLGAMLEEQGDFVGAAAAYRRASESGDAAGAVNLGHLLARHHDVVGAEAAYRRASALGDQRALDLLAELVHRGAEQATASPPESERPEQSAATVPSPENERPEEPAATQAPEPAVESATDAPPTEPATGAHPTEPAPAPPARLNDVSSESQRRIERVKVLQAQLRFLGFDPGPADGRYGRLTTDALSRFQYAHDLPVDGVFGPATAKALRAILKEPVTGDRVQRVKALQGQLASLGLDPGPIDGRYGPLTTAAVTRFQQAQGLPVDGWVGPLTARALAASAKSVRPATAPRASEDIGGSEPAPSDSGRDQSTDLTGC